jgi:hypothetical protein
MAESENDNPYCHWFRERIWNLCRKLSDLSVKVKEYIRLIGLSL